MALGNKKVKDKSKNLVFSGVLALTLANIVTKVIGLLFKIPIHDMLGDAGMAYFNTAYTVYVWFYMISTAGIPVALSILVAESRAKGRFLQVKRIFSLALKVFFVIGAVGTALMAIFSSTFAGAVNKDARLCIIALAPTLFFVCLSSAHRGYFQGFRYMIPTSVSEVIESSGKLILGILFAGYAKANGEPLHVVAAYAVFGLTVGVAVGMLYLWVTKLFFREESYDLDYRAEFDENTECETNKALLSRIIKIALPITISSSAVSLASLVDMVVMTNRLQSTGLFSLEAATELYGNYTTLCVTMFNLPPVLIYPIAYAIVPLVSEYIVRGEKNKLGVALNSAFCVGSVIAFPCALGMSVAAHPILSMLFGEESADIGAPLLSVLAIGVIFIGIVAVTNSVLQSAKKERLPIISMVAGAAVKLISSYLLIGTPEINIFGTPLSTVLCYVTAAGLNLFFVVKYVGFTPNFKKAFLMPLVSASACAGTAWAVIYTMRNYLFGGNPSGRTEYALISLCSIGAAVAVYVVMIFLTRTVDGEDIKLLPKGNKIYTVLRRLHFVK